VVVVDEASASDKIELVLESLGVIFWVTKLVFTQVLVNTLDSSLLQHIWTDIKTVNIFESLF